ncbi:unnamed protein product [Auanema sp. JU1783]|nr:unnamed protein product [Auanema sp. JU1783]
MTIGVIYFVFMELIGLGIPFLCLSICFCFHLGTPAVSHYAMISIGFYPIFGPYYVLMSNKDYRNRVSKIMKLTNKVTIRVVEGHKTV